jgi:DNA invertase Pin-like site-specific DNA recombinase
VIVWKVHRFARSVSHPLRALVTFQSLGVHFVSLSESLDTSTPAGKMVFTVLGAVAGLERSLIVKRVKARLRNARAKGKRLGRPRIIVDASGIATLRKAGVLGDDLPGNGAEQGDRTAGASLLAQKRFAVCFYWGHRLA